MKQALIERMLYVVLALVFVVAGVSAYFAIQAIEKFTEQQRVLQEQVSGQKAVLKGMQELLSNQGKTSDDINKSLSCILVFFSSPNRATYYVSDLQTCTITNSSTGKTEVLPLPQSTPSSPFQSTPSSQTQSATVPQSKSETSTGTPAEQSSTSASTAPVAVTINPAPSESVFKSGLDAIIGKADNVIGAITHLVRR